SAPRSQRTRLGAARARAPVRGSLWGPVQSLATADAVSAWARSLASTVARFFARATCALALASPESEVASSPGGASDRRRVGEPRLDGVPGRGRLVGRLGQRLADVVGELLRAAASPWSADEDLVVVVEP